MAIMTDKQKELICTIAGVPETDILLPVKDIDGLLTSILNSNK